MKKSTNYFKIIICTTLLLLCSLLYFQGQSENVYSEQELENDSYTTSSSADFTVSLHTTDIDIIEIDKININETIKLICKQNGTDSLNISMFLNYNYDSIGSLEVLDENEELLDFDIVDGTNLICIYLKSTLNENDKVTIKLNYRYLLIPQTIRDPNTDEIHYFFQFTKYYSFLTEEHSLTVRLPQHSYLYISDSVPEPCLPLPDSRTTTADDRPIISWTLTNFQAETASGIVIHFTFPPTEQPLIWLYIIGPLLGLSLGGACVYLWMKRGTQKLEEEIEKIYLTRNQELLLKLIEKAEGKITQQKLIEITKFTKSKVSRNLTPLEENGLIEKEKWGREFKVSLTNKGIKVAEKIVAEEFHKNEKLTKPDFSKEERTNIEMRNDEDK